MMLKVLVKNIFVGLCLVLLWTNCKQNNEKTAPKTGDSAIDALTESIYKNPNDAQLYFKRAQLFFKKSEEGGYNYAIEDMKQALQIDSNNLQFHYFLADMYIKPPEGEQPLSRLAVATMERAVGLYPDSVGTMLKLAKLYYLTQQFPPSMQLIDRALKRDAQNSDAFFLLGMNFRSQNKMDLAVGAFQRAADLNAKNTDAFIEIAALYAEKDDPKALKYLDNALAVDPNCTPALLSKAVFYQTRKQYPQAIEIYKDMQTRDPHNPDSYFNLGLLYLDQDSVAKAKQHFEIAINEKPTYFKAYFFVGECEEKMGNREAAIKLYKQSLSLMPNYQRAQEKLTKLGVK